ncbi:MAG: lytic transglycosylase domain-containing protein [Rhizomicrobium sp.]|jgi:soluble lytic murein transglycosylase
MNSVRALLLSGAALLLGAAAAVGAVAFAEPTTNAPPGVNMSLPSGLLQKNNTVMMAPIADSNPGVSIGAERRPGLVRVLTLADRNLYLRALEAAERRDWSTARGLAAQGSDPVGRRLIEWRYLLDGGSGASFTEIFAFLYANPDWPNRDTLFARAEGMMDPHAPPQTVLAFFQGREPVSGIGKVRLGEAYLATGDAAKGAALIRDGWIDGDFDVSQEFDVTRRHPDLLTPEVSRARLNRLLIENELSAARREMVRAPADTQQVAQVRLALQTSPSQGVQMLNSLPASLQWDPNLMFDRARLLRQQNQVTAIAPVLSRAPTRDMARINPGKVWSEISTAARQAIQDRYYTTAHALIQYSGLTTGAEFTDAEFLAGWLDLRFLRHPREARTHFINVGRVNTRPVSKARGYYWAGRSDEAAGDYATARQDYYAAAQYDHAFYGQLALAKLAPAQSLRLRDTPATATAAQLAAYQNENLTHAIRALADMGMVSLVRAFATYDAQAHPEPWHVKLLVADLTSMGFTDAAIRASKTASYSGTHLLAYSHPVIAVPRYTGPGSAPEQAFVLAVIRQETEFDPAAVSGAGARGLMQLMPASAQRDAGRGGLAYMPDQLLSNTSYNMQLGMVEMAENLARYGGSYILTAAAYNAGPGNVSKWINTYGDPRSPVVDPLDWIEEIPFAETRNYVQRVMENMEIYRNRISGRDEPLRIVADLYRPRAPDVRPLPPAPAPAAPVTRAESAAGRVSGR